jgi:hypothetical protein
VIGDLDSEVEGTGMGFSRLFYVSTVRVFSEDMSLTICISCL